MATAEAALVSSTEVTVETALLYRDGLIIALLALVPLRRRTLAALTLNQHLVKTGDLWLLDIPAADTKTRQPLEFPLSDALSERIDLYLARFRNIVPGARDHDGLWPSMRGRPMDAGSIYDMVRRRTKAGLGFPVNLHRFRLAAGNFWSIADPANVRGVKDLLGHTSFDTLRNTTSERNRVWQVGRSPGASISRALAAGYPMPPRERHLAPFPTGKIEYQTRSLGRSIDDFDEWTIDGFH